MCAKRESRRPGFRQRWRISRSGRTRNGTRLAGRLLVPASLVPFKRRDRNSTKAEPFPSAANDLVIVTPKRPMRLGWSSLIIPVAALRGALEGLSVADWAAHSID